MPEAMKRIMSEVMRIWVWEAIEQEKEEQEEGFL
jgi:hypothetical protein